MRGLVIVLVILGLTSCNEGWDCTQREGEKVVVDLEISETIKSVWVFDDINVVWHQAEDQLFQLETGQNLVDEIIVEVTADSILQLRNENTCRFTRSPDNVVVHVYSNEINYVEKFGFGEVNSSGLLSFDHRVEIVTRGSGNVNLDFNSSEPFFLTMRSLSNVTLTGEVPQLNVFVDRRVDGRLYATELIAQSINFVHSGTNDIMLFPVLQLTGDLNSFGNALIFNNPDRLRVEEKAQGRLIPKYQ